MITTFVDEIDSFSKDVSATNTKTGEYIQDIQKSNYTEMSPFSRDERHVFHFGSLAQQNVAPAYQVPHRRQRTSKHDNRNR